LGAIVGRRSDNLPLALTNLPCSCGGVLRPHRMKGEYDASVELGLPTVVTGSWLVERCDKCGGVSLPGAMLEALSDEAVLLLLKLERRLSGAEAKFLRKAALGVGQEELARRLGVTRVTVARWEGERSLSAPHDFELRGHVAADLLKKTRIGGGWWRQRRAKLVELVTGVLESARSAEAPKRPPPLRLAKKVA